MRFSIILAGLPVLAAAQQGGFAQYKAQFQNLLDKFGSYVPKPVVEDPVGATEAKVGSLTVSELTLENWKDTLYKPVKDDAKSPEEWLVLITGRNKTCYGRCETVEKAFNATAGKFAVLPKAPHMAILNCDDQPVLCNSWSAGAGVIWAFEMLPAPAAIDIYGTRLNLTSTTSESIVADYNNGEKKGYTLLESFFHPFNGKAAELGVAVPLGYLMWGFGLIPQWAFMIIVSFASRTFMGNRMAGQQQNRRAGASGAGAPAAAAQ